MKNRRRSIPTRAPRTMLGTVLTGMSAMALAREVEVAQANLIGMLGGPIPSGMEAELERRHIWFQSQPGKVNPMLAAYQSVYDDVMKGRA